VDLLDTALRAARPVDDRITGDREAAGRLAGVRGVCRWPCRSWQRCWKPTPGPSPTVLGRRGPEARGFPRFCDLPAPIFSARSAAVQTTAAMPGKAIKASPDSTARSVA